MRPPVAPAKVPEAESPKAPTQPRSGPRKWGNGQSQSQVQPQNSGGKGAQARSSTPPSRWNEGGDYSNVRCYNCGQWGHIARFCPLPQHPSQDPGYPPQSSQDIPYEWQNQWDNPPWVGGPMNQGKGTSQGKSGYSQGKGGYSQGKGGGKGKGDYSQGKGVARVGMVRGIRGRAVDPKILHHRILPRTPL